MSQENQDQTVGAIEKIEMVASNEVGQNPATVSADGSIENPKIDGIKTKDKSSINKDIRNLKNEIERIQLANSKVEDAKNRGIPPGSIADDISFAGLSIQERQENIRMLEKQKESAGKKIRKVFGMLFSL